MMVSSSDSTCDSTCTSIKSHASEWRPKWCGILTYTVKCCSAWKTPGSAKHTELAYKLASGKQNKTKNLCCHPSATSKSIQYPRMSLSDYTPASAWYVSGLPYLHTSHIANINQSSCMSKQVADLILLVNKYIQVRLLSNLMIILLVDVLGMWVGWCRMQRARSCFICSAALPYQCTCATHVATSPAIHSRCAACVHQRVQQLDDVVQAHYLCTAYVQHVCSSICCV